VDLARDHGNPYYYSGGVYYAPQGNGYAVVPPPKGAVIPSVPDSSTTVYGGDKNFAYSNGVFYVSVRATHLADGAFF